jgi:quercetin dioxygenase-like cupin family protein
VLFNSRPLNSGAGMSISKRDAGPFMHVTRHKDAKTYPAAKHHGMVAMRLQGGDASPAQRAAVGLSIFQPGGGAEAGSSPTEKIYVILEGEITVSTADNAVTLGPLDSILIEANENRVVLNKGSHVAKMLVISPL